MCSLKSAINSTIDSSYGHMIRSFSNCIFYLFIFRRLIQTSQNLL
nr:MAG TPA: hypothetical protein [Caudoviricetes sp.]